MRLRHRVTGGPAPAGGVSSKSKAALWERGRSRSHENEISYGPNKPDYFDPGGGPVDGETVDAARYPFAPSSAEPDFGVTKRESSP